MITEMKKRKYELRKRAERQQQTRERIVDAAMALHEEIGPLATTISAIAERAGVQRLTVYRHFPDERAILGACSSKWLAGHPPPDLSAISETAPDAHSRAALEALYAYYQRTEGMWASVYRDAERMDEVREVLGDFEAWLEQAAGELLAAWSPRRSRRLKATLAHVVRFSTWQSLAGQGLDARTMAALAATWIGAAAG